MADLKLGRLPDRMPAKLTMTASRAGDQLTSRDLNIQPKITIQLGATVRHPVHKDLFLAPWYG